MAWQHISSSSGLAIKNPITMSIPDDDHTSIEWLICSFASYKEHPVRNNNNAPYGLKLSGPKTFDFSLLVLLLN